MAAGFRVRGFWASTSTKAPLESSANVPATTQGLAVDQPPSLTVTKTESVTQDEVYYDAPTSPLLEPRAEAQGSRPRSASRNSVKTSGLRVDTSTEEYSDWKAYPPPPELLEVCFETAPEIQNIITSSVERVQERLAQGRRAREKTRTDKVKDRMVIEPVVVVDGPAPSGDQEAQTLQPQAASQSRMSNLSIKTASSGDSGYVSSPVSLGPSKRRIRALNRLVGWASRDKEAFSISAIVKPSSGHAHSISIPLGTRSVSEQPSSSAGSTGASTKECVSCLDDFSPKEVVMLTCHSYCKPCFTTLISTALGSETYWPPRCCLTEIPVEVLLPQMDKQTRNSYKKVAEERSIPAGDRIYCHSCSTWVPPKNINRAIACAACQSCRKKTCTSCRDAYHANGDCPADPSMRATLKLAEERGWRRCYSCKAMVEHNNGCLHMTCKCKAQFCYVCGVKWRTCTCSDAALAAILATAQTRRLEAQARDRQEMESRRTALLRMSDADAADLQDILARIEEFETKEAVRIANEVEKRRLEAEAARQQRQEDRIMLISKKYHDLRNELEFVHSVQKLAIADRFNDELARLRNETEILRVSYTRELESLRTSSRARIESLQKSMDADFEEKKAKEREIELDYLAQLREFWSGHPQKDVEIEAAMNALTVSHHEAQLRWSSKERAKAKDVMDAEMANVEAMERRHIREMSLITQDECRIDTERLDAEGWLDAIVHERNAMLGSLEDGGYAAAVNEAEAETDEEAQAEREVQVLEQMEHRSWGSDDDLSATTSATTSATASGIRTGHGSASASVAAWTELASVMARPRSIPVARIGRLAEESIEVNGVRLRNEVRIDPGRWTFR